MHVSWQRADCLISQPDPPVMASAFAESLGHTVTECMPAAGTDGMQRGLGARTAGAFSSEC